MFITGGVPVTAYARVNHCHNPVDVTFQVSFLYFDVEM